MNIAGPATVKLGQSATFNATGTPDGGSYVWARTANLVPNGSSASISNFQPGNEEYITVSATYRTPKGKSCSDTKWVSACFCTLEAIAGPSEAEVGQEVEFSTNADSADGTYTWTIENGTGTLAPNGSTAKFIGEQTGPVEIKASYVPRNGGEPCTKYHTIEITNECEITLNGSFLQRPICRPVNFHAIGIPENGKCEWNPTESVSSTACSTTYNSSTPGYETLTVSYTTDTGSTCEDSKSIISYKLLDNMKPIIACYPSGSSTKLSDFSINTIPSGFQNQAILSPTTVTTSSDVEKVEVTASLVCEKNQSYVSTQIEVVDKTNTDTMKFQFNIPDHFIDLVGKIGITKDFIFQTVNEYNSYKTCCTDRIIESASGSSYIEFTLDTDLIPIYGIPIKGKFADHLRADISAKLIGKTKAFIKGEKECNEITEWNGGGAIELEIELNGGAKAAINSTFILETFAAGSTKVTETLNVKDDMLSLSTNWGGLTGKVSCTFRVEFLDTTFTHEVSRTYFASNKLPTYEIELPSL